jgi:hypothetical protein
MRRGPRRPDAAAGLDFGLRDVHNPLKALFVPFFHEKGVIKLFNMRYAEKKQRGENLPGA